MALFSTRKPAFQLTGITATPDGLYDRSFVVACVNWWNAEVARRDEMRAAGYRPFTREEAAKLCQVVQPESRAAFEAIASAVSPPGRLSTAILSLSYAFALVADAGRTQVHAPTDAAPWTQARALTPDDLQELERHYSQEGVAREYELWMPFWMAAPTLFGDRLGPRLIGSLRAVFDDQVDRWITAEGAGHLRNAIGPLDYSLIAYDESAGMTSCLALLFEWGGRLHLAQRFLADGVELVEERFGQIDETGFIDHLYAEAYDRFVELASQTNPFSEEVIDAVEFCAAWLGDLEDGTQQLAIATVAKRAYLWRTAHEQVNYHFMEPGLSEAIANSRSVGEGRSADEPFGLTLYYAASQCMADGVHTRLGSMGGRGCGAKCYEHAVYDTTADLPEQGLVLDEQTHRSAFQFGVSLADVEHLLQAASRARDPASG